MYELSRTTVEKAAEDERCAALRRRGVTPHRGECCAAPGKKKQKKSGVLDQTSRRPALMQRLPLRLCGKKNEKTAKLGAKNTRLARPGELTRSPEMHFLYCLIS
jgi:hypothetical protein